MKRRVVSVLIAGILFFSNIGVTSFAASSGSSDASSAASKAGTEGTTNAEQKKNNDEIYGEEGISYFKITDFTELPEDISNQKIRVGGKLEDLELPDTLEVTVEPDYEHDERIERGLAQERERIRKEREELEANEGSSDRSDEASSSSSEDGETIIFFDDDGTISEEADELISEENEQDEDNYENNSTLYEEVTPDPEIVEESTDSDTDNGGRDEGSTSPGNSGSEEYTDGTSEESSDESTESGLISWLSHTFRNVAVAHAADTKDNKAIDEGTSLELISDVEWILEPEYNYGVEEFSADREGEIYLFTPVLLIPDTYYVEDELPIITVTVTDDYYAFDKETVVDDVKIRVRADKGVFPEGARVTAKKLAAEDEEKVNEVVDEQLDSENVVKEYTFDITIKDKEGYEVQPDTEKGRVVVSFETAEVEDETLEAEVYHIIDESKDDREPEEVVPVALGGEREKERVVTIFDENSVLKAEKLKAEVVEIEDVKVLAAETDGFSPYRVVFKGKNGEYTPNPMSNIISVSAMVNDVLGSEYVSKIESVDITSAEDYLYLAQMVSATPNSNGVYENNGANYFLIIKRPFKTVTVKVTCNGESFDINVTNDNNIDPVILLNDDYPVANNLGSNSFGLSVEVTKINSNDVVLYQWQRSKNKDIWSTSDDIKGANCAYYSDSKAGNGNYENNYWYRCCVNGVYSEPVQIVTANSLGNWIYHYGDGNQCYVSNGTIAYTRDGSNKLDFVGYFNGNGENQFFNSTFGGSGWTFCCDDEYHIDNPVVDAIGNLSHLWFSFDKDDSTLLHVNAGLIDNYNNFSILGNAQVGADTKETTLSVYEAANYKLHKLATLNEKNQDTAQAVLNDGQGNKIPVFEIIPKTDTNLWNIGQAGQPKAYTNNREALRENNLAGVSVSWRDIPDSTKELAFDLKLSGLNTAGVLIPYSKIAVVEFSGTTNIVAGKENGNQLTVLAKSLGTSTEDVTVKMDMKGKTSASSTLTTAIANDYKSSTTQTVNGTSATSTQYKADYLDIKVTKEVGAEDPIEVKESEFTSNVGIELAYNFSDKDDIRLYRVHKGTASRLRDSYSIDRENGKIYIYTKQFSEYAVAYKPVSTHVVTFNDLTTKWTVTVKDGEKVAAPEGMPTKDGVTALYWYKGTVISNTSSTKPTAYDFNTPVTGPITLNAYYPKTFTVTFSGISPSTTVKVTEGDKVARPADPVKEGYTFKGWYSDKTAKTLYNFDTPVTKDLTLYAGFVDANGRDADDEDGEGGGSSRAPGTRDTLPPVWLWVLVLIGGVVTFSCNLYARAKEGKVKFSQNKNIRKITRVFLLVGLVIVTVVKFLIKKVNEKKREVALGLSGAVILVAAGVLIFTSIEYHKSERAYGDASKTYVQETQEIKESAVVTEEVNVADNDIWWSEASVEMETLTEEYPDAIGWIYFENEDISYPIMYSGDNTKYLNTSYDGEKARAGAIFLDGESTPDFSDPHSLIYGHNMRDLTMFGKLRYYKTDASYYDEHQYFQIFTKDGVYRYQIFAYEEVPDSHDVFWVYGKDPEGMWDMLQDIEGGSYRQTGIEATESDHVITLATCTSKEDRRLIVSALRTDEHDYGYVASSN